MFDHFILTRFNVREPWANATEHLGLDDLWLERRFDLFEKTCLPSMIQQSQKSFQWLIFLDEETPGKFVARMDGLSSKYEYLIPIYCADRGEEFVLREMKDRGSASRTRIMTRLDNDDVLHPRMIEKIQKVAQSSGETKNLERGFFISFPLGYSELAGDYYLQFFRCNPFVSFVSVPEYKKTIFGWDHTKIGEVAPVVCKYTLPMWCQIIHGENVSNTVRGLYSPWGKLSGMVGREPKTSVRSFAWQCKEFGRTFKKYILHR